MDIKIKIAIALILLLTGIFIVGNFGITDGIPSGDPIFGQHSKRVIVIGKPSTTLVAGLTSKEARDESIWYAGAGLRQELLTEGMLKQFDVVILQNQAVCDSNARRVFKNWVNSGGKLMVIGDSCSRIDAQPDTYGWNAQGNAGEGDFGDIMPANLISEKIPSDCDFKRHNSSATFIINDQNHPLFLGVINFDFDYQNVRPVIAYPKENSIILLEIKCASGSQESIPAILETPKLEKNGKVLYFAIDPSIQKNPLFINSIIYVSGKKKLSCDDKFRGFFESLLCKLNSILHPN